MKIIYILLIFICKTIAFGKELPIDKIEFLFKDNDVNNISMAKSMSAFVNETGLETNSASVGLLRNNYYNFIYEFTEFEDVLDEEVIESKKWEKASLVSPTGGLYYKNIKREIKEDSHKFRLSISEVGITSVNESISIDQLYVGMTLKGFLADVMEGKIDGNDIDLILDNGKGLGLDLGILLKQQIFSFGLAYRDIYSRIFFSEYDNIKINSRLNVSLGFDYSIIKYGFSIDKLFLKDSKISYGNAVDLRLIHIPAEFGNYFVRNLEVRFRKGVISDQLIEGNIKHTSGLKISNNKVYANCAIVSNNINPMDDENVLIKLALGGKF